MRYRMEWAEERTVASVAYAVTGTRKSVVGNPEAGVQPSGTLRLDECPLILQHLMLQGPTVPPRMTRILSRCKT
jgi:hypothetical protein